MCIYGSENPGNKSAGKKKSRTSKSSKKSGKKKSGAKKGSKRSSPGILKKAKKTLKAVLVGAAAGAAKGAVGARPKPGSKATGIADAGSGENNLFRKTEQVNRTSSTKSQKNVNVEFYRDCRRWVRLIAERLHHFAVNLSAIADNASLIKSPLQNST